MSAPRAATKGTRPGGRSARVRGAVLDAALRALLADGFESLSVASVAREAGVAETTVYRRWPTKGQLAAAALAEDAARHNPTPDTGSLRSDLDAFAQQLIEVLGRPEIARSMRALAGLGDDVPGVTEMRQAFRDARAAEIAVILDRARARGELDRAPDATTVLEQLAGPLYLRFLIGGTALDGGLRDRSVAAALQVATDAS